MGGCSVEEHSWAWIDPRGQFIDTHDHGTWAYEDSGFREQIIDQFIREGSGTVYNPPLVEALSPAGYRGVRVRKDELAIVERALRSAKELGDLYTVPQMPARKLEIRVIQEEVLRPVDVKWMRSLRTFAGGQWIPERDQLSREDNKFVFAMDDRYGDAWYVSEWKTLRDPRNERIKALWEELNPLVVREMASKYLVAQGWMMAGNPFNVGVNASGGKPAQWETFFKAGVKCLTQDPVPMEFWVQEGRAFRKTTWGDMLSETLNRDAADEIFGMVLAKFHRRSGPARVAFRYTYGS